VFWEVVNSGEPISNDVVPSLLEPFRRANSRVGDAEGAGLGLAIVNAVATSHHGRVALNGCVGGGLEILVQLPIQTKDVARNALGALETPPLAWGFLR
jgi:signal transduction histidine kinase